MNDNIFWVPNECGGALKRAENWRRSVTPWRCLLGRLHAFTLSFFPLSVLFLLFFHFLAVSIVFDAPSADGAGRTAVGMRLLVNSSSSLFRQLARAATPAFPE